MQNDYIHIHSMFVGSLAVSFFLHLSYFFPILQPNEGFPCVCVCVWVCYRLPYTRMNFYSICKATTSCTIAVLNTRTTSQRANGHFVIPAETGARRTRPPKGQPENPTSWKAHSAHHFPEEHLHLVTAICMSNCLHFAVLHLNATLVSFAIFRLFSCCCSCAFNLLLFFPLRMLKIYLFMRWLQL